jgi:hypothetical protein
MGRLLRSKRARRGSAGRGVKGSLTLRASSYLLPYVFKSAIRRPPTVFTIVLTPRACGPQVRGPGWRPRRRGTLCRRRGSSSTPRPTSTAQLVKSSASPDRRVALHHNTVIKCGGFYDSPRHACMDTNAGVVAAAMHSRELSRCPAVGAQRSGPLGRDGPYAYATPTPRRRR